MEGLLGLRLGDDSSSYLTRLTLRLYPTGTSLDQRPWSCTAIHRQYADSPKTKVCCEMPPQNDLESEYAPYKLLFEGMHPRTRDCDPRAYFRAKLAGLRQLHECLLADDEYATERQGVLDDIILPARYPPSMLPVLLVGSIGGIAGIVYGLTTAKWTWVAGALPVAIYSLWALHGFRKHHAWLNAISKDDRVDIINYLRDSELIDENEVSTLMSRLDTEFTNAT